MESVVLTDTKSRKPNPDAVETARIIKLVAISLGIKINELGEVLQINKQQVYDYTMGKQVPKWQFWMKLKQHYPQVSAEFMLTGKGEVLLDQ